NFLLLGTDKRTADDFDPNDASSNTWTTPGPARADTIMLVHVPKGNNSAYVISIPRDAYIYIPSNAGMKKADIKWDGGKSKVNAAFAYGGSPLMVSTLQQFSGLTIDYPILLNFKAVRDITDAVGGVDVIVDRATQDYRSLERFPVG